MESKRPPLGSLFGMLGFAVLSLCLARIGYTALRWARLGCGMLCYGPILHDETPILRTPAAQADALTGSLERRMHVFFAHQII